MYLNNLYKEGRLWILNIELCGLNMSLQDFWSDKFCRLCLEFEAMSHGVTERTEAY